MPFLREKKEYRIQHWDARVQGWRQGLARTEAEAQAALCRLCTERPTETWRILCITTRYEAGDFVGPDPQEHRP